MFENFEWSKYIGKHPTAWAGHISWAYTQMKYIKPEVVVELGVHWGHSFFTMAEACKDWELDTKLYGVDHWEGDVHAGKFTGEVYDTVVGEYKKNIIEIPRMDLVQGDVKAEFKFFDLDTTNLSYQALDQEIIRLGLKDRVVETLKAKSSGSYGNPIKMIISELIDYPEIDYDDNAELLHHLASQAYNAIVENIDKREELLQTIFQFKASIAEKIYLQMKSNENFILHYSDNGKGLEDSFTNPYEIFDFGTTSKFDINGEQVGTGLGMYIVASTIREYNATFTIVNTQGGFSLDLIFPE